jgi:hypothetical protein
MYRRPIGNSLITRSVDDRQIPSYQSNTESAFQTSDNRIVLPKIAMMSIINKYADFPDQDIARTFGCAVAVGAPCR